nr:PEP-CTERM sorting domain-containing protein [uncultured Roseateles sp.]
MQTKIDHTGAKPAFIGAITAAAMLCAGQAHAETWQRIGVDSFSGDAAAYKSQGLTTDGQQWFFSSTNGLERANFDYSRIQAKMPAIADALAAPSSVADRGLNHIGDIDVANGTLYISLDTSRRDANGGRYNTPVVALYNAADLSYTGQSFALRPPGGTQDIASWVAVDAAAGIGYSMAYDNATKLIAYKLSDWSFDHYVTLSQTLDQVQGAKLRGDWLYMASDGDTKSIYRTHVKSGAVEELFQIKTPFEQEIEGISFRDTPQGLTLNVLNIENPAPGVEYINLYHYALAPVPELTSVALLLAGLGLLAGASRRRSR